MNRLQKATIILKTVNALRTRGSWCGETHLQKAAYFLQELGRVPLGFEFILYKHGPFSFDLRDELTAMRADGLLEIDAQPRGSRLYVTQFGDKICEHFAKTIGKYRTSISFVEEKVGNKGVAELERLTTALFVIKNSKEKSPEKQAIELHDLKPYISASEAHSALETVRGIVTAAEELLETRSGPTA